MNQIKTGAILSYFNIFLTVLVGLVLTPFIIRSLGKEEYGLYTLIGSFVGYISIMDLGLNNTTIRYVAKYRATNDKKGQENFLATIYIIYGFISLLVIIIGACLYFNLPSIFPKLSIEEMHKAKMMFLILIFNLALALPGGNFLAVCSGCEKFIYTQSIMIIKYILRTLLVFTLLRKGGGAITLVVIDTIMNLLVILVNMFYVFRKLNITSKLHTFNKSLLIDVFSYSIWIFIYMLVYKFQWNAGQIVLGMTSNVVTVGIFGVGVLLGGYYSTFAGVFNNLLVPKAVQMMVENKNGLQITENMIKIGRISFFVLGFVLSGFILWGRSFVRLWVGDVYHTSWVVALLSMIAMTLPLIEGFGNSILEAKKKNRFKSLLSLTTMSVAVITGFFLSKTHGIYGMIFPLIIALVINSFIMNFYYRKIFGFKIGLFFKKTLLKPVIVYFTLAVAFIPLINYYTINHWTDLLIQVLLFAIFYCVITYYFIMDKTERELIKIKKSLFTV